ncbi:MAG: type I 3-dehydroquinate dehydratase [Clostridiales bacterium]|nr:type I 3-dehydroquinate dehydratase [Clostridiales bacterium]
MDTLEVKEMVLQPGRPKVVVPIVGTVPDEIVEECEKVKTLPCDIIEWRADYYLAAKENLDEQLKEKEIYFELVKILDDINYIAGSMPVIFTLRRKGQGGEVQITKEQYNSIWSLVAQSKLADIIDVELFDENGALDEASLIEQINEIHAYGSKIILSYHDFNSMPTPVEIVNLAKAMGRTGADIYKIAAMAYNKTDAENLLKATAFLNQNDIGPLVMLAMGEWGKTARVAAGRYGSCMTFASGKHQSAPGQVDAHTLKKWLDDYYGEEKA